MLRDKPHLQFVPANDVADDEIIGPVIARVGRAACHRPRFLQHDLVCVQQSRNLHRWLFTPLGRARNERRLRDIRRHRHAHPTEELNPFGDRVNQRVLLVVVLVEQQMQLIEGRTRSLPVVFLVQIAQRHRVGEKLIQIVHALLARLFR